MHASIQIANPWLDLPKKDPFVLPSDRAIIERINACAKPEHQIRLEVLPVPFLGSLEKASVVLLSLNPGIDDQDFDIFRRDKDYVEQNRRTLSFESNPSFFYLGRQFAYTEGYKWWFKRLRKLIEICGHETVASKIMCIEYFPYHSRKYATTTPLIPSQNYGFSLARQAIAQQKVIVVMRSYQLWIAKVPELGGYPSIRLSNSRSPYITPTNMPVNDFQRIVTALSEPHSLSRPARSFFGLFRRR